jgi:hypothetical protein
MKQLCPIIAFPFTVRLPRQVDYQSLTSESMIENSLQATHQSITSGTK